MPEMEMSFLTEELSIGVWKAHSKNLKGRSRQSFWSVVGRQETQGKLELYYRRISVVKQCKPLRGGNQKI